ncbi:hypothetical protein BpHYR1_011149 [Brachionus plicatilis]|uniref:Uncharacterized protein n=1 Tax=Brachionus plicatilis TaxID=10195 RepID=A0A3M7QSN3_BRAPC|nr:hypothetical protein BpHYR1_011149 [Brachionus plicatilis]
MSHNLHLLLTEERRNDTEDDVDSPTPKRRRGENLPYDLFKTYESKTLFCQLMHLNIKPSEKIIFQKTKLS